MQACVRELGLDVASIDRPEGIAETSAVVARLGGDEFTLILPVQFAEAVAERIISAMQTPVQVDDIALNATTSIGIGIFPDHANTPHGLLKIADTAMYQAKQAGQNCYQHYDARLHDAQLEEAQLQSDLRTAIQQQQFVLYLQPQFEVSTGRLSGAEALVRWQHPERGLLAPDMFLPTAAGSGLLPGIGREISRLAIEIAQHLQSIPSLKISLAINLSVEELVEPGFVDDFVRRIRQSNLDPSGLEIEITENTAMFDDDIAVFNIELLQSIGVRLAIDDFGVGFSNLARLKNLAFDTLKIDKSLLPRIEGRSDAEILFNTILELSDVVQADVIAEGVETPEQLAFLQTTPCRYFQGYLGGRPMPVSDFMEWLDAPASLETHRAM